MTDRPIIFSAPMVRALLEGRKTQTRRVVRQPQAAQEWYHRPDNGRWCIIDTDPHHLRIHCDLPYRIGDRLYVREAWSGIHAFHDTRPAERESFATPDGPVLRDDVWFWADGNPEGGDYEKPRPSIHMPRWASRLTLTVADVRVQRLQEISDEDAWAEGCKQGDPWDSGDGYFPAEEPSPDGKGIIGWDCARDWYADLWDHLHGPDAWAANPWVVALTFTVQHGNIDANPTQIQGPQP